MLNNLLCQKFKQNINNIIKEAQLPPVVAYYILKDSLNELEKICNETLQSELNAFEQQNNKNKDNQSEEA